MHKLVEGRRIHKIVPSPWPECGSGERNGRKEKIIPLGESGAIRARQSPLLTDVSAGDSLSLRISVPLSSVTAIETRVFKLQASSSKADKFVTKLPQTLWRSTHSRSRPDYFVSWPGSLHSTTRLSLDLCGCQRTLVTFELSALQRASSRS